MMRIMGVFPPLFLGWGIALGRAGTPEGVCKVCDLNAAVTLFGFAKKYQFMDFKGLRTLIFSCFGEKSPVTVRRRTLQL